MKLTGNIEAFAHTLRLRFKINFVSKEETSTFIILYHKHHAEKYARRNKGFSSKIKKLIIILPTIIYCIGD